MPDYLNRTFRYGSCLQPVKETHQIVVGIDKSAITDFAGHSPLVYNSVEEMIKDLACRTRELEEWLENNTLTITTLKVLM